MFCLSKKLLCQAFAARFSIGLMAFLDLRGIDVLERLAFDQIDVDADEELNGFRQN